MKEISFEAKLRRPVEGRPAEGGEWLFLRLPQEASAPLPSRGPVSVDVSVEGGAFTTTLQPDGEGGHWMKVGPEVGGAGETVSLAISVAAVEPEPDVPEDLRAALADTPAALAVWNDITPASRRDWILWITTGKKAETRVLRLGKMMDMLTKGKRRICCFDRSGMYSKSLSCPVAAEE